MSVRYEETKYGFIYGQAHVKRIHRNKDGSVVIRIVSPRQCFDVRITPTGLIRPFNVWKLEGHMLGEYEEDRIEEQERGHG